MAIKVNDQFHMDSKDSRIDVLIVMFHRFPHHNNNNNRRHREGQGREVHNADLKVHDQFRMDRKD